MITAITTRSIKTIGRSSFVAAVSPSTLAFLFRSSQASTDSFSSRSARYLLPFWRFWISSVDRVLYLPVRTVLQISGKPLLRKSHCPSHNRLLGFLRKPHVFYHLLSFRNPVLFSGTLFWQLSCLHQKGKFHDQSWIIHQHLFSSFYLSILFFPFFCNDSCCRCCQTKS
mgnify:CR=1 FL=1